MLWWGNKKNKQQEDKTKETTVAKVLEVTKKREEKIYIVGSKHQLATKCFDWNEPFDNLADCDKLIINLNTLNEDVMKKLSQDSNKINRTKREVLKLLNSNGEIYCVIAINYPLRNTEGYGITEDFNYYCWSPIIFFADSEIGDTIILNKDVDVVLKDWIDNVENWSMLIRGRARISLLGDLISSEKGISKEDVGNISWGMNTIAQNRYGGVIAGSAYFSVSKDATVETPKYEMFSGLIHLLPPPTKISVERAIDNLLMRFKGVTISQVQPDWVKDCLLPGEKELREKITQNITNLNEIEKDAEKLKKEQEELLDFKGLLFQKGTALGYSVKKAFEVMKFEISDYEIVKGKEDFILRTLKGEFIIEVKGADSKSISLQDLRQLVHYVDDSITEGKSVRGILIGNPYCLKPLQERNIPFPDNVQEFARKRDLILMTSSQLFQILSNFIAKKITADKFLEKLIKTQSLFEI